METDSKISDSDFELVPGYWIHPETGALCSIPWPSDPEEKRLLISSSLGPGIIDWAEGRTEEPGLTHYQTGQPWQFTDGQKRFLILWYSVKPDGRWRYRSGVKRGAKGTGKDPFGAAWLNIELLGPCRIVDMDGIKPIGAPHLMPLVQIASNSEAQSKDMMRVANALWSRDAKDYYGLDCGETRTTIKGTGRRLEVLTASEGSSEGDPSTAIALNESHHMTASSGGKRVADVARRNVGKSPAHLQARLLEFTNAHLNAGDSVAEDSYVAWQAQVAGKGKKDILYDSIEADPRINILDDDQRMRGIRQAYMDAPWSDLERINDEILDARTSVADTIRFYFNGLATAEDAWVEPGNFDEASRPGITVKPGDEIAMFLDCSKSEDATGLVGARLSDGHVMTLGVWQKPHGHRGKGWLAPRESVDAAVRDAFRQYRVRWFGVDPSPARDDDENLYWMPLADEWHRDFHKDLTVWATPGAKGHSVLFDMRTSQLGGKARNALFTETAMQTQKDIDEEKTLTHDGHPALRMHVHNAKNRPNQWGTSLGKVNRDSKKLVDLAVCMVGARMGRRVVLNSGKLVDDSPGVLYGF